MTAVGGSDREAPVLTIHRSAHQIGGNCIEIACAGHRLLLDAGNPLDAPADATVDLVPPTLDTTRPVDAIIVSHPHQDHYGLLRQLPADWPVWCGASAEELMRLTLSLRGESLHQSCNHYRSGIPFAVGPFTIKPFLTDHSAFDAHMLLIEVAGKRILYSGDFRRSGRKAGLVERMIQSPPRDVDVLLLEGTTLGREERFPTEDDLEGEFAVLFRNTPGRVFVTWSAQNIDRTVTLYRACLKTGRTLILDIYTLDVLRRLGKRYQSLPQLEWTRVRGVVTAGMRRLYHAPARANDPEFFDACCRSPHAFSAVKLESNRRDNVIMLRPSVLKDYQRKGVTLIPNDAWVFSMWTGYLDQPGYLDVRRRFQEAGASIHTIHTSGHASSSDLKEFATRIAARHLVPIHGFEWDRHVDGFANVTRLQDGECFAIG